MNDHHEKLKRLYASAPINRYFAPALEMTPGEATITMEVRGDYHHAAGAKHGVVYFKALDDAAYFAANSTIEDVFVLTSHFELEFLKPVSNGTIVARGRVLSDDGRRVKAASELMDERGDVVGRGSGTFVRSRMALP